MKKRGFRELVLSTGTWLYRVGNGSIVIFSPSGSRYLTDQSAVSGLDWDSLERGYWKKWFKGVTPKMIRNWIEQNMHS